MSSTTNRPTALRTLLIVVPDPPYKPYPIVEKLQEQLGTMFSAIEFVLRYEPEHCTREALLETLRAWVEAATPGQAHLLYFHGHGGRVSFADLPADQAGRITYYLHCPNEHGRPSGLLDVELSSLLTQLHARCGGNVTVIIDSCHSGGAVKSVNLPAKEVELLQDTPGWIAEIFARASSLPLAANSHPGIVRLTASSPARWSRSVGGLGRFTRHLLAELAALGDDWCRSSWTLLAHRIRQQVIDEALRENQWISLAGPGDRLLFSLNEADPARAIGLVEHEGRAWLRAGRLTGVSRGDRWAALASLVRCVDSPRLQFAGRLDVCELPQGNRSLLDGDIVVKSGPRPRAATLVRAAEPMPVQVVACPALCLALPETTWLTLGDACAAHRVRSREGTRARELVLEDGLGRWPTLCVEDGSQGRAELLELLEDRARTQRLRGAVAAIAKTKAEPVPLVCELAIDDVPLCRGEVMRVRSGQTLSMRVHNRESLPQPNQPWQTYFATALMIDALGRPLLLNSGRPDGIELGPNEREAIGERLGGAARGLVLGWPAQWRDRVIEPPAAQRIELLVLLSDRQMPLAHLTRPISGLDANAFHMQGLPRELATRGDLTEHVATDPPARQLGPARAWQVLSFELSLSSSPAAKV